MIVSDEGSELVDQPYPSVALYDYPAQEQWDEFQRLAQMLMRTPFSAEGIVTGLFTDANGTRHVELHSMPDSAGLWRYIATSLLMLTLVVCMLWNAFMALRRYQRSRTRLADIQQYYDNCLNPKLIPTPESLIG